MKISLLLASVALLALTTAHNTSADVVILAQDDASQSPYVDGWDDGDNGGLGFEPWSLAFDGDTSDLNSIYNSDPHFIDGVGVGPLPENTLGAPSFGLTTDGQTSATASATRIFNAPLQTNQSFKIDIDGSALEGNPRIGNVFELLGSDGVPRYRLNTALGLAGENWISQGTNIGIASGESLRLSLSLIDADTFSYTITPLSLGGFNLAGINIPLTGTAGAEITGLRVRTSGTGSSVDGVRELFFNNLEVSELRSVPEPSSMLLSAISLVTIACMRRRRAFR